MIEDVMKALERIPLWKRVAALPDEIEALKNRIEALERRLNPAVGDICPKCKELTFVITASAPLPGSLGRLGATRRTRTCSNCGFQEQETLTPK